MANLIIDKHWKPRDVMDLLNAPIKMQALFYASLIVEAEEIAKNRK